MRHYLLVFASLWPAHAAITIPAGRSTHHDQVTSRQVRWSWRAASSSATTCGYVEYGTASNTYTRRTIMPCPPPARNTDERVVNVSDLTPGTTWYYRITHCDATANTAGCVGSSEVSSEFSFTTPADSSVDPVAPTLYQPTVGAVTGSSLTATCGTIQAQIDAAAALDTSLHHEIVMTAGTVCDGRFTLPSKSGTGWVTIRSSAIHAPTGTRVSENDAGLVTFRCASTTTLNSNCISAIATQGWRLQGIKVEAAEPYLSAAISGVTQGASSVCGLAADTWTITVTHGYSAFAFAGQMWVINGVTGFTSNPTLVRAYSYPSTTSMIACSVGATSGGSYVSGGTLTKYMSLPISSAVSAAGTSTITTASAHGMSTGTWVTFQGLTGLNGSRQITRTGANTFTVSATHGTYTSGAILSYGPGFTSSLFEGSETTSRIVFDRTAWACSWPARCTYTVFSAGTRQMQIKDSVVTRMGWYHNTGGSPAQAGDFIYATGYSNGMSGGSCIEPSSAGPITVQNTSCVGAGILIFMQEGRADATTFTNGPNADFAYINGRIEYDSRCDPSASTYTQLLCAGWHSFEIKAGIRVLISGNTIIHFKREDSVAAGDWFECTPRCGTGSGSCLNTQNLVGDVNISNNTIYAPGGMALYGQDQRGDGSPAPASRFRIANNVIRLDGRGRTAVTAGFGHLVRLWNIDGLTIEGNSIVGRQTGGFPAILQNNYQRSSRVHVRRNILAQSHDSSNGGFDDGDISLVPVPALVTTMPGKFADQYPAGGWAQNIIVPQVLDSTSGANCWASTAGGCNFDGVSYWSGFTGATLVGGANADARIAAVGWLADDRVAHTSTYAGYGATIDPILDAAGSARAIGLSGGGSTISVRWWAPSASLCSVDRSNDAFATWTRLTGSAGSISRSQSANFTSVPSGTWAIRIHCGITADGPAISIP